MCNLRLFIVYLYLAAQIFKCSYASPLIATDTFVDRTAFMIIQEQLYSDEQRPPTINLDADDVEATEDSNVEDGLLGIHTTGVAEQSFKWSEMEGGTEYDFQYAKFAARGYSETSKGAMKEHLYLLYMSDQKVAVSRISTPFTSFRERKQYKNVFKLPQWRTNFEIMAFTIDSMTEHAIMAVKRGDANGQTIDIFALPLPSSYEDKEKNTTSSDLHKFVSAADKAILINTADISQLINDFLHEYINQLGVALDPFQRVSVISFRNCGAIQSYVKGNIISLISSWPDTIQAENTTLGLNFGNPALNQHAYLTWYKSPLINQQMFCGRLINSLVSHSTYRSPSNFGNVVIFHLLENGEVEMFDPYNPDAQLIAFAKFNSSICNIRGVSSSTIDIYEDTIYYHCRGQFHALDLINNVGYHYSGYASDFDLLCPPPPQPRGKSLIDQTDRLFEHSPSHILTTNNVIAVLPQELSHTILALEASHPGYQTSVGMVSNQEIIAPICATVIGYNELILLQPSIQSLVVLQLNAETTATGHSRFVQELSTENWSTIAVASDPRGGQVVLWQIPKNDAIANTIQIVGMALDVSGKLDADNPKIILKQVYSAHEEKDEDTLQRHMRPKTVFVDIRARKFYAITSEPKEPYLMVVDLHKNLLEKEIRLNFAEIQGPRFPRGAKLEKSIISLGFFEQKNSTTQLIALGTIANELVIFLIDESTGVLDAIQTDLALSDSPFNKMHLVSHFDEINQFFYVWRSDGILVGVSSDASYSGEIVVGVRVPQCMTMQYPLKRKPENVTESHSLGLSTHVDDGVVHENNTVAETARSNYGKNSYRAQVETASVIVVVVLLLVAAVSVTVVAYVYWRKKTVQITEQKDAAGFDFAESGLLSNIGDEEL